MFLVQATCSVSKHLEGQVVDDILNTFGWDGRLLWLGHGYVKQTQELFEGCLIHDVDVGHLHDQEVQDATTIGHC